MSNIITFSKNQLPAGYSVVVNNTDLIINVDPSKRFPHVTFHASAVQSSFGDYSISFVTGARYHVAVRSGVYVGRKYDEGWVANPDDTVGNFSSDITKGNDLAAILENVLNVI